MSKSKRFFISPITASRQIRIVDSETMFVAVVDVYDEKISYFVDLLNGLSKENEKLRKQIQIYEQLISNSYVGEEETLDGFLGKYEILEDELQKYRKKIKKVMDDE